MISIADRLFNQPLLATPVAVATATAVLHDRLSVDTVASSGIVRPVAQIAAEAQDMARAPREYRREGGVAVIPILGSLVARSASLRPPSGLTGYTAIRDQLETALDDPHVRGVLLEVDSPGGEARGAFELARRIREASAVKPVWAVANEVAFSAAYAIASAAQRVTLPRSAEVGSIGVVLAHLDRSGELEKRGHRVTIIHAGAHKVDGHPFGPLSAEITADLQASVNDTYDQFVGMVAEHRGLTADAVRATEARCYRAPEAIGLRLADGISSFEATLRELRDHVGGPTSSGWRRDGSSQARTQAPGAAASPIILPGLDRSTAAPRLDLPPAASPTPSATTEAPMPTPDPSSERERISAILGHEKAAAQMEIAKHMAFNTSLSAADAIFILENVKSTGGSDFAAMMARIRNPRVGADDLCSGDTELEDEFLRRMASYRDEGRRAK